jgi:hypothetical protein
VADRARGDIADAASGSQLVPQTVDAAKADAGLARIELRDDGLDRGQSRACGRRQALGAIAFEGRSVVRNFDGTLSFGASCGMGVESFMRRWEFVAMSHPLQSPS